MARRPEDVRIEVALVVAASIVAGSLIVVATAAGAGISPDSIQYVSAAVNLDRHGGFDGLDGTPLTVFPPLLSLLLAAGMRLGASAEATARAVNVLSVVVAMAATRRLLLRVTTRRTTRVLALATAAFSPTLVVVGAMVWSESLFIAITMVLLVVVGEAVADGELGPGRISAIAALASAGFLTRYTGIVLVGLAVVGAAAAERFAGRPIRVVLTKAAVVGVAASAVPIAWMVRNLAVDGTVLGPRVESPDGAGDAAWNLLNAVGRWAWPTLEPNQRRIAERGALLLLVTAALGVTVIVRAAARRRDPGRPTTTAGAVALTVATFTAAYLGYLLVSQVATGISPLSIRLLAPALLPTIVSLAYLADRTLPRRVPSIAVAIVVLLLVVHRVETAVDWAEARGRDGEPTASVEDALADAVTATASRDEPVFSNRPETLWVRTRHQPTVSTPLQRGVRGSRTSGQLEAFATRVCEEGAVLVAWYDGDLSSARSPYPLDDLAHLVTLEPLDRSAVGTLYRATAPGRC